MCSAFGTENRTKSKKVAQIRAEPRARLVHSRSSRSTHSVQNTQHSSDIASHTHTLFFSLALIGRRWWCACVCRLSLSAAASAASNMADCKENNDEPAANNQSQSQIVMKIDSPEESSDNSVNEETEKLAAEKDSDSSCSSNSMSNSASSAERLNSDSKPKGSVLAASKFGNSFGVNSSNATSSNKPSSLKPSLLRPSQLGAMSNSSSSSTPKSVLQPAKLQNPFTKVNDSIEESEETSTGNKEETTSKESDKGEKDKDKKEEPEKKDEKEKDEKEKEKEVPKFLALSKSPKEGESNVNSSAVASSASSPPSFVFGQNLKERVAVAHDSESKDDAEKKDESSEEPMSNENGSSELMFSNAAAVCKSTSKPGLTLSQAAQEMEEANRANKRKYSEVTLLTGEEDETNVLQINCKLFAFDKAKSSYQERGRGSLRLNDRDEESRLVARAAGTQRLVLNTKVWPGMTAERAGPKSLRLTAMDAQGEIRIFVVQAAQKEVEQLHNLLLQRLKRAQERQPKKLAAEAQH